MSDDCLSNPLSSKCVQYGSQANVTSMLKVSNSTMCGWGANCIHPSACNLYVKPDSSLLIGGKPFFYPYFSSEITYRLCFVVKICKLGKTIAEKFAHRYYDEVTVGVSFTASDLQRELMSAGGLSWDIAVGFDGSAVVGNFVPLLGSGNAESVFCCLAVNGEVVQNCGSTRLLPEIDKIIAYISLFYTLKTGDLIFLSVSVEEKRAAIDDRIEGYLNNKKLLSFNVK